MKLDAEIALAHRLADAAREAIRPYFRSAVAIEQKDDASPVTLADREADPCANEHAHRDEKAASGARVLVRGNGMGGSRVGHAASCHAPRRDTSAQALFRYAAQGRNVAEIRRYILFRNDKPG